MFPIDATQIHLSSIWLHGKLCCLWKFSQFCLTLNHLFTCDIIVYSQELDTYSFLEVGRWVTFHESSWWEHSPKGKHCPYTAGLLKKKTGYIYPLQFNRQRSFFQVDSGPKCQNGQANALDLIVSSRTVLIAEDVIVSSCRSLKADKYWAGTSYETWREVPLSVTLTPRDHS